MGFRYSLSQVSVIIGRNQASAEGGTSLNDEIRIDSNNKSMLSSISFSRNSERFSAEGDATGGYVINETLDPTGEVVISVRQFAPLVSSLTKVFNAYDSSAISEGVEGYGYDTTNHGALSIVVMYNGKKVAVANGCFLNMPEHAFEEEAGDRDFTFVAGELFYELVEDAGRII